jgi:hypothetical protein
MICMSCPSPDWRSVFLRLLPAIRQHARIAFRNHDPESRDELIQAVIANACCAVARLAELDRLELAYASALARYGVAQVREGRTTGGRLNRRDVSSKYCQRLENVTVERLDHFDEDENQWLEAFIEDRTAGPAETARVRIDFDDWLKQLPLRNRRIARFLSLGNRTQDAAHKFDLSNGRVSQLRRELQESWRRFTGDTDFNTVA